MGVLHGTGKDQWCGVGAYMGQVVASSVVGGTYVEQVKASSVVGAAYVEQVMAPSVAGGACMEQVKHCIIQPAVVWCVRG